MLLFLDSHCECGYDWVQPLLHRIKEEPRAFVVPIIDVIDDKTMEYYHGNGVYFQIGGFTWSGHFNWIDIPEASSVADSVRFDTYLELYPNVHLEMLVWLRICLLGKIEMALL